MQLLRSPSSRERARGAELLIQAAGHDAKEHRERRARCAELLLAALPTEQDATVLQEMGRTLGYLEDARAVPALRPLKDHPDARVRQGVVRGLMPHPGDAMALQTLMELSRDGDTSVRKEVLSELALKGEDEVDSPELRDAFFDRVSDEDRGIRADALVGLARRKDPRALEPLRRELAGHPVEIAAIEAARYLEDASLVSLLLVARGADRPMDEAFEDAINFAIDCLLRSGAMKDHSIQELIALALQGDEEDETAWEAIRELHFRGGDEVFEAAVRLLHAASSRERGRGTDILAQLGGLRRSDALITKCADEVLAALATEQDAAVLNSMGVALGHLRDARAVPALQPLKDHPDEDVRMGVVMGMMPHRDPVAIQTLIELSRDSDEDVRNWATFSLGSQAEEVDTPELRDALFDRLTESDMELRGEALVGLALRKDPRVLEPLRRELESSEVVVLAVEAAEKLEDTSLLPLLHRLRDPPGKADSYFRSVLAEAIAHLEALAR
ncbi:hypothetical protein HMI51_30305 [Corallococcus coralloides]|nr:hypothetical protein [Corallococcus coralloides]